MTTREDKRSSTTAMKRAYLAMERMQRTIDEYERARSEPVAIVGVGCRFPGGVVDPASYWDLLTSGTDAISEVPEDRWDLKAFYSEEAGTPGKVNTRWGGFLDHIDRFDHDFFGISRREAVSMDPQQRMLLEVSWEALENAGVAPDALAGSQTGVFMGLASHDYSSHVFHTPDDITLHMSTGTAHSVAAGRLSYLLDLRGPSVAVDTACSSSLVAVHQACQNLRLGECDLALAGGVSALLSPHLAISFSQFPDMLSVDGRCKAFDARANGFVRGEGCGVVVLKRLSDALRDEDRVLAVVRGSALNQDGRSSGLTAPNGAAQVAVLERAIRAARIEPGQVGYIEAHGTGTKLGDPIEVEALTEVYGKAEGAPLYLGAAKTNVGHLEAASGIAGLVKAALCVDRGRIPPNVHFTELNPHISLDGTRLVVPTEVTPWPEHEGSRLAAVSSFGFSGTNAHLIIEQAPQRPAPTADTTRPSSVLALSAKTETALLKLARRYQDRLTSADPTATVADICYSANSGRSHFPHRLTAVGSSCEDIAARLANYVRGEPGEGLSVGEADVTAAGDVVFLFTGQGSQRIGMGRQLFQTQPTFRRTLERCEEILRDTLATPLLSVLYPEDPENPEDPKSTDAGKLIDDIEYAQPALFAVEYALATLWQSWGVQPTALVGHSLGEYAAACFAGVMSLDDGLRLVAERARLLKQLTGGSMAAVFAPADKVAEVLADYDPSQISIAAVNGPANTSISGERDVVTAVCEAFTARRIFAEQLRISTSSHSPLVEPVLEPLRTLLEKVEFTPPQIPLVANLTGQLWPWDKAPDAGYWLQHARQAVQFTKSITTLYQMGYRTFLEVGPTPVLLSLAREIVPRDDDDVVMLPSLRPMAEDWDALLAGVSRLYVRGASIDWAGFDRDYARAKVELPRYPFEPSRCWHEPSGTGAPFAWGRPIVVGGPVEPSAGAAIGGPGRIGWHGSAGTANGARSDGAQADGADTNGARSKGSGASGARESRLSTTEELLRLPEPQRTETLLGQLLRSVQAALGARSSSSIGMDQALSGLGLDSLMAVELRNEIQGRLGVSIPIARFLKGATIRALAEEIVGQLPDAESPVAQDGDDDAEIRRVARAEDVAAQLLEQLVGLPDEPVGTSNGSKGSHE